MHDASRFLELVAAPLIDELKSVDGLKKFTTNSEVIGAHAEAIVRRLVSRVVHPLRTCTGAVVSQELCANPRTLPQIDTIIWMPAPVPALFEVGEFGIVPRSSSIAILEIKRSVYSDVGKRLDEQLDDGKVRQLVADDPPGWPGTEKPHLYPDFPGLGVICLQENGSSDARVNSLRSKGKVVVLLEERESSLHANVEDAYRLINFLIRARQRAKAWDGLVFASIEAARAKDQSGVRG